MHFFLLQAECGCTEKTWQADENNRNKLGIDSADSQNHSEWRGRGRLWRKTWGGGDAGKTCFFQIEFY